MTQSRALRSLLLVCVSLAVNGLGIAALFAWCPPAGFAALALVVSLIWWGLPFLRARTARWRAALTGDVVE